MTQELVHFMHGKESGPGGSQIAALATVARAAGAPKVLTTPTPLIRRSGWSNYSTPTSTDRARCR